MAKFKLNWGWSMLLVYIIFMSVFLFYFWRSFKELESNELVTEDYYEKELVYGDVLAKKKNADTMRVQVQIIKDTDGLRIIFPGYIKNIEGNIFLYKPDNSKLDQTIPIKLDEKASQKIKKDKLIPGRWDVSLDWKINDVPYFIEKKITF
jgi:hypothetical protein